MPMERSMEAIAAQCAKHHFDPAVALCGQCGLTFCAPCLVYAFGAHKPPLCIPCALTVGGVRRAASAPKASWREKRARRKALAAQTAAASDAVLDDAMLAHDGLGHDGPEPTTSTAAPRAIEDIDWSAPFETTAFAD